MIDFICFSINNWEKRKARKQQFMLHLSKRGDVGKILYIEPPLNLWRLLLSPMVELKTGENRKRWKRALSFKTESLSGKLFLFTPLLFIPFSFKIKFIYDFNMYISCLIIDASAKRLGFRNIVLWLYHPFDHLILKWFRNRILSVFDWAEDWTKYFIELDPKSRSKIRKCEEDIIRGCDVVFVVSKVLLERAKAYNERSYQILDGTVPDIFSGDREIPPDMKHIPRPIIAYIGSIYRRVNVNLLAELSERLPDCSVVLLGNILYGPAEIGCLMTKKNIFFLGGKDYDELPDYMMNFDVLIMPDIPLPDRPPPTKVYDYFATGKPIVSTNIPEMGKFGELIMIAGDNNEFVSFAEKALGERDPQLFNLRKEMARNNSWGKRAGEIMEIISNHR